MNNYKTLQVIMDGRTVGTLAVASDYRVAFEYDREWIAEGYSISPLSLPLESGVFLPRKYETFDGLFGVFSDSLPDGWGRLLLDRLLIGKGWNPAEIDALNRLAIVGRTGMGALEYYPENCFQTLPSKLSLDDIALECEKILNSVSTDNLDDIFRMGGSSGGARPKVYYLMDGKEWIVKFPSSMDEADISVQEYRYSQCAKKCGIEMPETRLLPSKINAGYFAVQRFDRQDGKKIHMISVSGLLETSHRVPNLDYHILMRLTLKLTEDYQEIEKLYRQMCFNVFAHNRDDHSKNFSFLYLDGRWRLSPAYDLTYSNSIGGEHATMVNGNGRCPGMEDLLAVAEQIKWDKKKAKKIAMDIQEIVLEDLGKFSRNLLL